MSAERDHGEKCQDCRKRYPLVWWASAEVWTAVTGRPHNSNGLFCPSCFTRRAESNGLTLRWVPEQMLAEESRAV